MIMSIPPPLPARATTPGREQSSILAQYILLLLTDYSIKGACNPDDQNFALELVRQGSQNKKNMSLYACLLYTSPSPRD